MNILQKSINLSYKIQQLFNLFLLCKIVFLSVFLIKYHCTYTMLKIYWKTFHILVEFKSLMTKWPVLKNKNFNVILYNGKNSFGVIALVWQRFGD